MKKFIVFMARVFSGSFKRMFRNIKLVHKETGKPSFIIFFDMLFSMIVYGTGYLDYVTFGFANIKRAQRKTFLTMNDNISLNQKLNDPEYRKFFENKLLFDETFSSFLGREFLNLQKASAEELKNFCNGKTSVFAKQPVSFGGLGVRKIILAPDTDFNILYEELCRDKQYLVEETIVQHEEMNRLCSRSINTLRITTLTDQNGEAHCAYALVRVGNGKSDVDNVTSGGMYTLIGENGILSFPAFCDKIVTYYDEHPLTKIPFAGFQIPLFKESVELCLQAAKVVPQMRYVGWDVAVSENGPVLVEGNEFPGYDMPQNYRFHPDGCGLRPLFENILQEKI